MDRLTDAEPVRVERTVYVAESWVQSTSLCPGCGRQSFWFPLGAENPHVCIACGGVFLLETVARTDDHETVIARIRQAAGWAVAQDAGSSAEPSGEGGQSTPGPRPA